MGILLASALAGALLAVWAFIAEPALLTVATIEVADARLPEGLNGMRAVFITDLHVGSRLSVAEAERVAARVASLRPDLLLFGGDLTRGSKPIPEPEGRRVSAAFAAIRARFGKYAVLGNHDVSTIEVKTQACRVLREMGFTVLENAQAQVAGGLCVAGAEPLPERLRKKSGGAGASAAWFAKQEDFTIVLAHEPGQADALARRGFALQLSGHTHGGQVALPFVGALTLPYATNGYVAGRYDVKGMPLYVSRGVGTVGVHARFCCPPEILVVTLRRE